MGQQKTFDDQERARLKAILHTAVDAIITIDEQGIVQSANPATEKLFGFSADEVIGRNINMLMPSPFREEHDGYLHNYLRSGQAKIIGIGREVLGLHKEGHSFPMHLAVSESSVGNRRLFTGIVRDLTELRRAEAEQASLGRILDDSLNEIYIFDAQTLRFVQVNRGARENLDYCMAELREMTPVDLKPAFNHADFLSILSPLRTDQQEKLTFETLHQRKDGSTYEVEVHIQMGRFQEQSVFVAIILDVTSRKELERERARISAELEKRVQERTEQLRQAQEELVRRERLATLGKVSGGIAHEIRNPLNAVKTSAYYLLHATDPPEEKVKKHLERIDRQVTLIDNVVTALSDVARMPEAKLVPVDLDACLSEVLNSTSMPPNVTVVRELPQDLPKVLADEYQIPIAFRNLIRNARDAMPDGGKISIGAELQGEFVAITVQDEGVGIPPDELERILEPLYSTKARGMGLGLAITNVILEKNEGELGVRSKLGVGSWFTAKLRAA